jgi:tetratricopeptide (TPR) repeat protein
MPRRTRPRRRPGNTVAKPHRLKVWIWAITGFVVATLLVVWALAPADPVALRTRAEAAEAAKDWPAALNAWRAINRTKSARGRTLLGEARALLGLDLAGQTEAVLMRATEADPADPDPWRLWLELLRTEGRTVDALRVGRAAYGAVGPDAKRSILRELTLALLLSDDASDSLLDDHALARLDRWVAADPDDANARVAQHRRVAEQPRPGDPDRASWIATLEEIVAHDPHQIQAREALITALADAGEFDRGQSLLDQWPEADRNARYHRLAGRWDLEYGHDPARAAASLEAALADLPHDWKARSMLARVYQMLKRPDDARREAARVASLRELLDPATLVPRLATDFGRPDDPRSRVDLASLCTRAGLDFLADAWNRDTFNK